MSVSTTTSKHIVIIGNGAAGSQTAAELLRSFQKDKVNHKISVVSSSNYCEVSISMSKVLAEGKEEHEKNIYPAVRENGINYIEENCQEVTNYHIITDKNNKIEFDICVIATGHNIPIFMPSPSESDKDTRLGNIYDLHSKISDAQDIVIGGGGPIGCEVAADIKLRHKDKNVTIIHSRPSVLHIMSEAMHPVATKLMKKMNINIITNERIQNEDECNNYNNNNNNKTDILLSSGKTVKCDLFIPAHSKGGNTSFMPSNTCDKNNYIKVNEYFQCDNPNYNNIFSIGDVSNYDNIKTYLRIKDQMNTIILNINNKLNKKSLVPHIRGVSFESKISGPAMVALGHDVPGNKGLGPDLPGIPGWCLWFVCCCQPPHGSMVANMKSDFNKTVVPIPGRGLTAP
jgi:NADH dehydrogenase FAD-containing subunit